MFRSQIVEVPAGRTVFEIDDVPASFDPNTTTVEVIGEDGSQGRAIEIAQVDVRRPDKRIMEMFINREKSASDSIIQSSTDLRGSNREKIIQICESAYYRRYEDMLGTINVTLDAKTAGSTKLQIKYFMEDSRIKWRPGIHAYIDPTTKQAKVEGYIQVMNNSDFTFEGVELGFAQFELEYEVGEEGYLEDMHYEQEAQTKMPSTKMLQNLRNPKFLAL